MHPCSFFTVVHEENIYGENQRVEKADCRMG